MRKLFPLILISILLFPCCEKSSTDQGTCGLEVADNSSPQLLKILFIGNSHTYVNDIPRTVSLIAKSKGDSVYYMMSAPGGCDFQSHYKLIETISAIKSQKWDFVVLQESGWRTALPDAMADTMIYPYADSLYKMIKTNNESTKIILYMTHGYRDGASWGDEDPSVSTYEGMQERIKNTYLEISNRLNVPIAPAGMIWEIIMDKYPNMVLFQSDGIHAEYNGSYISACTIYSLIFNKKPIGTYVPENVLQEEVQIIQQTVSNVLFDCNPDWRNY